MGGNKENEERFAKIDADHYAKQLGAAKQPETTEQKPMSKTPETPENSSGDESGTSKPSLTITDIAPALDFQNNTIAADKVEGIGKTRWAFETEIVHDLKSIDVEEKPEIQDFVNQARKLNKKVDGRASAGSSNL